MGQGDGVGDVVQSGGSGLGWGWVGVELGWSGAGRRWIGLGSKGLEWFGLALVGVGLATARRLFRGAHGTGGAAMHAMGWLDWVRLDWAWLGRAGVTCVGSS